MGVAADTVLIKVDFPELGKPSNPTSASNFSSRRRVFASPSLPKDAWRGARLVLNKIDLLPKSDVDLKCDELVKTIGWKGQVHKISGLTSEGIDLLCKAVMDNIEAQFARDLECSESQYSDHSTWFSKVQAESLATLNKIANKQPNTSIKLDNNSSNDKD